MFFFLTTVSACVFGCIGTVEEKEHEEETGTGNLGALELGVRNGSTKKHSFNVGTVNEMTQWNFMILW